MKHFIAYVAAVFFVGFIGSMRPCGFKHAFIWSILLTPLVGLIIAIFDTKGFDREY